MKVLFVALALSLSSLAFADSFVCKLTVDGETAVGYEEYDRSRRVSVLVSLEEYKCAGEMRNGNGSIDLFIPRMGEEQLFSGATSTRGQSVRTSLDNAECVCSLM